MSGIALGGEGVGFGRVFFLLFTILYGIVVFINALVKKPSKFYWWLLLAISIPLIVIMNI